MFKQYSNKSSLDNKKSRYVVGGTTDVFQKRLGWWTRDLSFMTRQVDDIMFLITKPYEKKPAFVAYEIYKRTDLEWLVLQYNNIIDINEEFLAGTIIVLPSYSRTMNQITI